MRHYGSRQRRTQPVRCSPDAVGCIAGWGDGRSAPLIDVNLFQQLLCSGDQVSGKWASPNMDLCDCNFGDWSRLPELARGGLSGRRHARNSISSLLGFKEAKKGVVSDARAVDVPLLLDLLCAGNTEPAGRSNAGGGDLHVAGGKRDGKDGGEADRRSEGQGARGRSQEVNGGGLRAKWAGCAPWDIPPRARRTLASMTHEDLQQSVASFGLTGFVEKLCETGSLQ